MSIKKKNNGWYAYLRYRDAFGKVRQKKKEGFATKREACAWERNFRIQHEGKAMPGMTFEDLTKLFLKDKQLRWRVTTYRNVCLLAEKHIRPILYATMLDEITTATAREVQNNLLANTKMSGIMRKKIYGWISVIMNYGVKFYDLPKNPFAMKFHCETNQRQYVVWTKQQFDYFVRQIPIVEPHAEAWALLLYILFYGGLRRGEALALTVDDFDFVGNTISVTKSRDSAGIHEPKTKSSYRVVAMPSFAMMIAKRYIERLYKPDGDTLVLPFKPNSLPLLWKKLQEKYGKGLPRIRLHDLRHSHASMLLNMGISPQAIADRLGHANTQMIFKVYGHLYDKTRQEVAAKLDELT